MAPEPAKKCILDISVELQGLVRDEDWPEEHKKPDVVAYVFDPSRRMVAKESLTMEGPIPSTGGVKIELEAIRGFYTVKIGPDPDDARRILMRSEFPAQNVSGAPGKKKVAFEILKPIWWCWIKVPYVVTGTVAKDGAPICVGKVDIYDVDLRPCLWRLPPLVIERIRDALIDVIHKPPPIRIEEIPHEWPKWPDDWDDDWCGTPPRPKPRPMLRPDTVDVMEKLNALPREWAFAKERFEALPEAREVLDAELAKMPLEKKRAFLAGEAVEGVKTGQVLYSNTAQFRELLIRYFPAFRFWLCWYPWIYWLWWPWCWWYCLEYLGTAELQSDGSFTATLWLSICRKDTPDLWFRVWQNINGINRVIYARYPVPCHTYWNHPSGLPVHLTVTHPEAVVCYPDPEIDLDPADLWIVPLAIGNYSLNRIYGTSLPLDPVKSGLYRSIGPLYNDGPFGGMLGLRIEFSPALEDAGVKYYRIKRRVNGVGAWVALDHREVRHYSHVDAGTGTLKFEVYELGPQTVGSENTLFEIRPADPPNKAAEPYADWVAINLAVDTINAHFDSSEMTHGYVEFKVELFDSTGARVDPATFQLGGNPAPIAWKLPTNNDVWNTITTAYAATVDPALVSPDPEAPAFQTFIFKLRIDNRPCKAIIDAPTISGVAADPNCGMLQYGSGDPVHIVFHANHPATYEPANFSFARFQFEIKRADNPVTNAPPPDKEKPAAGEITLPSVGVYTGDSHGNFYNDFSANHLLEGCTVAAFAESLHVWAKAYNGWRRLSEYDDYTFRAFGLQPQP